MTRIEEIEHLDSFHYIIKLIREAIHANIEVFGEDGFHGYISVDAMKDFMHTVEHLEQRIKALEEVRAAAKAVEKLCEEGYSDIGGFGEYDHLVRTLAWAEGKDDV